MAESAKSEKLTANLKKETESPKLSTPDGEADGAETTEGEEKPAAVNFDALAQVDKKPAAEEKKPSSKSKKKPEIKEWILFKFKNIRQDLQDY